MGKEKAKGLWVGSLHEMKDGGMAGGGIEQVERKIALSESGESDF